MLIVDSFAGGGGASTGIEMALGRSPDIAINHDPVALAMHAANHPACEHLPENVWQVDLEDHARRRGDTIGLLWASPDCRHFSKARGGRPTSPSVRGLAWTIVKFVRQLGRRKPRVIIMENVEEFRTWEDFDNWAQTLKAHGYRIEARELRACDYGAPTIRKRLFIVMRCDGEPIVWPLPTHGAPDDPRVEAGALYPWRTAAECIDWSIPCPSIFDTSAQIMEKHGLRAKRPLAEATLRRIAAGIQRYVIDAAEPFFVSVAHGYSGGKREYPIDDPFRTVTTSPETALVVPTLVASHLMTMRSSGKPWTAPDEPTHTITASGAHLHLVSAFLAQHNTGVVGRKIDAPMATVTTTAAQIQLVSAFMVKYYGAGVGQGVDEPCHTVTTKERFGLVTVTIGGVDYAIVDIGMRMLTPRELFRAQGFPTRYIIDRGADGTPITKTQQIHKCGNSVSPWPAKAIVQANCGFLAVQREAAE